jgi:hypothetical protein
LGGRVSMAVFSQLALPANRDSVMVADAAEHSKSG